MRIDFVSDIACPWCAVGLMSLERALARLGADVSVELHFQPFELNPDMAAEGADAATYLKAKYGMSDADLARNREVIRERGAAVGFEFGDRPHVWNTFDAHRLLHWAGTDGQPRGAQRALKHALLQAYHGQGRDPSAVDVLLEAARSAGLDTATAQEVIADGRYAEEVRAAERAWRQAGIGAVPSVVIDGHHLIQGGQPSEVFERALREIAASKA